LPSGRYLKQKIIFTFTELMLSSSRKVFNTSCFKKSLVDGKNKKDQMLNSNLSAPRTLQTIPSNHPQVKNALARDLKSQKLLLDKLLKSKDDIYKLVSTNVLFPFHFFSILGIQRERW
jgi:hypothetical protein